MKSASSRKVVQTGEAADALDRAAAAEAEEAHAHLAGRSAAGQQPAGGVVVQEVEHPVGRVEEVERVRGRRRVEHDQVVHADSS